MDLLVRLYDLPIRNQDINSPNAPGVKVRRARSFEKTPVVSWVKRYFGTSWGDECSVSFSNHPVSCYIALEDGRIIGFACHETTFKNFFGPIGVVETARGRGIGRALFIESLYAMASMGYGYAVIGDGTAAKSFYSKILDTMEIPGSSPGIYHDRIKSV
jgi:predicted acetyltransferase